MNEARFAGRTAIVTGAAYGIGRGIARRLAREGCRVIAADINEAGAIAAADDINQDGGAARAVTCDVTSPESVARMIDTAITTYGELDYLVNNAGGSPRQAFDEVTPEDWAKMLDLNLTSQFLCVRAALPHLRRSDAAAVVNIGSLHAWVTVRGLTAYAAAKGGVVALTTSLALELGPAVRVNAVAPGVIETEAWFAAVDDVEAARQQRLPFHPLGRLGQPEDIAAAVAFLLSADAAFITGVTLPVDGGLTTHLYRG